MSLTRLAVPMLGWRWVPGVAAADLYGEPAVASPGWARPEYETGARPPRATDRRRPRGRLAPGPSHWPILRRLQANPTDFVPPAGKWAVSWTTGKAQQSRKSTACACTMPGAKSARELSGTVVRHTEIGFAMHFLAANDALHEIVGQAA